MGDTAVVVPARNEQARVGATVHAAWDLPGVDLVVVVDDGSTDRTARCARAAGALVVRHCRSRGKGAAVASGVAAVARVDRAQAVPVDRLLLLLDADLGATAAEAAALVDPVRAGTADMTVARLPRQPGAAGVGLVVGLSRLGTRWLAGPPPAQPLCGQRCLRRTAYDVAVPLAAGFGLETGLNVDVLRAGLRVVDVDVALHHRVSGRDWAGQRHRARQLRDVARALVPRLLRSRPGRVGLPSRT